MICRFCRYSLFILFLALLCPVKATNGVNIAVISPELSRAFKLSVFPDPAESLYADEKVEVDITINPLVLPLSGIRMDCFYIYSDKKHLMIERKYYVICGFSEIDIQRKYWLGGKIFDSSLEELRMRLYYSQGALCYDDDILLADIIWKVESKN